MSGKRKLCLLEPQKKTTQRSCICWVSPVCREWWNQQTWKNKFPINFVWLLSNLQNSNDWLMFDLSLKLQSFIFSVFSWIDLKNFIPFDFKECFIGQRAHCSHRSPLTFWPCPPNSQKMVALDSTHRFSTEKASRSPHLCF